MGHQEEVQDPLLPRKDSVYPQSAAGPPRILLYIPVQAVCVAVVPEGDGQGAEYPAGMQSPTEAVFWGFLPCFCLEHPLPGPGSSCSLEQRCVVLCCSPAPPLP